MERYLNMADEDKVHIKIELCKNKDDGKIEVVAHFNKNAPNVIIENNEYFWMPTLEEKDLLNETFDLISGSKKTPAVDLPDNKEEQKKEIRQTYQSEKIAKKEEEPAIFEVENKKSEALEQKKEIKNYGSEIKPDENIEAKSNFQDGNSDFPTPKVEVKSKEEILEGSKDKDSKEESDSTKDKEVIVEADGDAIEKALNKHKKKDEDDDSFVEADEKTIIDRVLKQKKKGKWRKK